MLSFPCGQLCWVVIVTFRIFVQISFVWIQFRHPIRVIACCAETSKCVDKHYNISWNVSVLPLPDQCWQSFAQTQPKSVPLAIIRAKANDNYTDTDWRKCPNGRNYPRRTLMSIVRTTFTTQISFMHTLSNLLIRLIPDINPIIRWFVVTSNDNFYRIMAMDRCNTCALIVHYISPFSTLLRYYVSMNAQWLATHKTTIQTKLHCLIHTMKIPNKTLIFPKHILNSSSWSRVYQGPSKSAAINHYSMHLYSMRSGVTLIRNRNSIRNQ